MKKILSSLWRKLFYSPYFFTIALRKKASDNIIAVPQFDADFIFPATYKDWCADPILIDFEEKTYLFYEAVKGIKGQIEVVQVFDDGTVSTPTVILEDNCHHSYPFVFHHQQQWYMIPESSESEEVCLYKATAFPEKWEPVKVLMKQKSVDTTVFEYNGSIYLLTYLLCPGSERVQPQAYRLEWDEDALDLLPIAWDHYDALACRGAGQTFLADGALIRPAQLNYSNQYGNAVLYYQISTTQNAYSEVQVGKLMPEQVNVPGIWMDGLHTYAISNKFEAIDIRCREFEAGKILRVLRSRFAPTK